MLNAKQFTIALTTGLCVWLGTTQSKTLRSLMPQAATSYAAAAPEPVAAGPNAIQVALLLDTSSSMDGLIEQAKSQLWKILNELNRLRKNGEVPDLEIALYEYGNVGRRSSTQFQINQLSGFTTDMDLISQKLFSLTTNGGDEYCGAVIQSSLEELAWKYDAGMKIIYIAGNEPFTQGPIGFAGACAKAVEKGIIVNTIHCGDCEAGIQDKWQAGAKAGHGEYLCIDQDQQTVYVQTPYDDQITVLNSRLNDTYVPLGKKGEEKKMNQKIQDENASQYSVSNSAERAAFKATKNYKAEDWDLVDAYKKDKLSVTNNRAELPDSLRSLSIAAMEAKIEAIAAQREAVQQEMQQLDAKRRQYIEQQSAEETGGGLEDSILQSLRKQAAEKGFEVEKS